jgi:RNA polymerase sigma factor (sigma-70 family)
VKSQQGFRGEASFRTFLFAIAHNVLRQHLRSHAGQQTDLGISSVIDSQPSPPSLAHRRFELATLQRGLSELPDEHRTLLQLTYDEQLTSEQVAALLEIPSATVRTRLRRAKELLREQVEKLSHQDPSLLSSTLETFDLWAREPEASE